ncbi:MAG TPA: heavy metal translocating P-type ATPase, partial [Chthoniobacterales bacterium]|nr:heavy metal translocating P-type ATPase [Chthoniobacterales bacterium]
MPSPAKARVEKSIVTSLVTSRGLEEEPAATPVTNGNDLEISCPAEGGIRFRSRARFGAWQTPWVRQFVETSFGLGAVQSVEVDPFFHEARLYFDEAESAKSALQKLARIFRGLDAPDSPAGFSEEVFEAIPASHPRLRTFRHGDTVSTWEPRTVQPGMVRLGNPLVLNKEHLVRRIERELVGLLGIERYRFHPALGAMTIEFRPEVIHPEQIVIHLDQALVRTTDEEIESATFDNSLTIASVSLGVAVGASFVTPVLLPVGAALMLYTAMPSFRRAWHTIVEERRLGVDVLDSIIFVSCLFTGQIFAGAMTAWFLSFGRKLLLQTQAESTKILLEVFGKQASLARVLRNGVGVEIPIEQIEHGDRIEVHTGEAVPVDGIIRKGDAVLDQHSLTGESTPVEKTVGDSVLASTLLLAGTIIVEVERTGKETTASQIGEILTNTVAYKLRAQSRGEEMADQAVIPTLGLAAVAALTVGPSSGLAVINSEVGTGIRMAAPLGMLTSITRCARNGILVKDGRALENMRKVDTVLFDKTGTLTREKPEVHRIFACDGFHEDEILTWAAAAEQRFSHPIARAVLEHFARSGRPLPALDSSKYKVGYGISVEIGGRLVRVGSRRFLEQEKVRVPAALDRQMQALHAEGHSFVCVAAGGELAGVIELRTSHRPEAEEIITGLRARGVDHIAIISGDHEQPTRRLAEHLGVDRHFAEVLPQDKARYVELLQAEGRTVCFVGDGINDSIALKKANVSISLRGASTIATDTAQIVFMEESLARVCDLFDYSHDLERNVNRSWNLIAIPNGLCVAGVFLFG